MPESLGTAVDERSGWALFHEDRRDGTASFEECSSPTQLNWNNWLPSRRS